MVTSQAFTYDLNGNTTASGPAGAPTVTYGWDPVDHLISVTTGGNVTTYDYDGFGRRVREKVNGVETRHWLWDGLELCEERVADNSVTKRFYEQGEQISGNNYCFTRDHLGSVRELLDSRGTVATGGLHARYNCDLYGARVANSVTVNPVESDFGFTGHQEFTFEGVELLGAPFRIYQPVVARWLSRDPLMETGGINLYGYVSNSPIISSDRLGLAADLIILPPGDATAPFAEGLKSPSDVFIFVAHGNQNAVYGEDGMPLKLGILAARIMKLEKFKEAKKIIFLPSNTGNPSGDGGPSIGQRMADVFKKLVEAPNGFTTRGSHPSPILGDDEPYYYISSEFTPIDAIPAPKNDRKLVPFSPSKK
jgi:RHS repeat-associated protein